MAIVIHPLNFFGTNRIRVAVTLKTTRKNSAKTKVRGKLRKCNSYVGKVNYWTPIISTTTFTFLASLICSTVWILGWSEKIKFVLEIRNSAKNLSFGRKRRFVKSERFLLMFRSAPRQLK